MIKLSADSYRRARGFLLTEARPLERALFLREFEGAPAAPVFAALADYRNADGGFGHALEPDLRMAASSALATATGLDVLRELGADDTQPLVRGALAWVAERFDAQIPGWRYVPADVDAFPRAPHWNWELHRPGGPWDHLLNPGARFLSHWSFWPRLAPRAPFESLSRAFAAHVMGLTTVGPDSLNYAAEVEGAPLRAKLRELARTNVSRDPSTWGSYCARPLKLAPTPESPLAECLTAETARNLDWEIGQQGTDGSWQPNWTWDGAYPADWEIARREWQGQLTLRALRSLRAYGRIEGC
ncbi:MAG: hypothetical protein ACHQ6T_15835 [Myxococcota bacterium]